MGILISLWAALMGLLTIIGDNSSVIMSLVALGLTAFASYRWWRSNKAVWMPSTKVVRVGFGDDKLMDLTGRDLDCDYYVMTPEIGDSRIYTRNHLLNHRDRVGNGPNHVEDVDGGKWYWVDGDMVVARNGPVVAVLAASKFADEGVLNHMLLDLDHHSSWSYLERDSRMMLNLMNPLVSYALQLANGVSMSGPAEEHRESRRHRIRAEADHAIEQARQSVPLCERNTPQEPPQPDTPPDRPRGRLITLD